MMKLRTLITVLFLALATAPGFAGENGPSEGEAAENIRINRRVKGNVYELTYLTDTHSDLRITLQDSKGNTLFKKRVRVDNSVKIPFNLKYLPFGRYTFIINNNGSVIRKEIDYTQKSVEGQVRELSVSLLDGSEEKNFKLIALGAYQTPIDVLILDLDNNLIHKDRIRVSVPNFSKVYDLSKVPTTHFKFKVYSNDRLIANNIF